MERRWSRCKHFQPNTYNTNRYLWYNFYFVAGKHLAMSIRFTAYVEDHDKVTGLYFKHENENKNTVCVTVYSIQGEVVVFSLCRTRSHKWETFPQQIPLWIKDLEPLMIAFIESRCHKWRRVHWKTKKWGQVWKFLTCPKGWPRSGSNTRPAD